MTNTRDLYALLRVSPNASTDEIRKAFRKLAMQYHPDRNPGSATASRQFAEIREAYRILADRSKRAEYDQFYKYISAKDSDSTRAQTFDELQERFNHFSKTFAGMDPFRMDTGRVYKLLKTLLSEAHMELMKGQNTSHIREQVLYAAQFLPYEQVADLIARLDQLYQHHPAIRSELQRFRRLARQYALWSRYKTWIALAIALLFCLLLFSR